MITRNSFGLTQMSKIFCNPNNSTQTLFREIKIQHISEKVPRQKMEN
jgi:hypothetical protein